MFIGGDHEGHPSHIGRKMCLKALLQPMLVTVAFFCEHLHHFHMGFSLSKQFKKLSVDLSNYMKDQYLAHLSL